MGGFFMQFRHYSVTEYDYRSEYGCDIFNDSDIYVGYCKYYKSNWYENIVYIEYIYIYETYRRMGYATQMVLELKSRYELKWDYRFTDMGRVWYDALCKKDIIKVD